MGKYSKDLDSSLVDLVEQEVAKTNLQQIGVRVEPIKLNKSNGRVTPAIPNIDWSKERDYEHLTLDDIMNILREENPDVA